MEETDREKGPDRLALEGPSREKKLEPVPVQAKTWRAQPPSQLLPPVVPFHNQRHRRHREQLALRQAQSSADQLQVRKLKRRLLPPVRRCEDCVRPERQYDQDVGQKQSGVHTGTQRAHRLCSVSTVRRKSDHFRLLGLDRPGVGRPFRRHGQHAYTSL